MYMIYKHYERKEHIAAFLIIILLGTAGLYTITNSKAATIINDNIQSGGNLSLLGTASSILFGNSWKFSQTAAPGSQITVTDSANNTVLIFDEN